MNAQELVNKLLAAIEKHGPEIKVGIREWEQGNVMTVHEAEVWHRADDKQNPMAALSDVYVAIDWSAQS